MNKWYLWAGSMVLVGGATTAVVAVLREARDLRAQIASEARSLSERSEERAVVERRVVFEPAPRVADVDHAARTVASADFAPEEPAATAEEAAAEMEARFESDRPVTSAARATEATLREALSNPDVKGATLENLECRASTCRAQVTFSSEQTDVEVTRGWLLDPKSPLGASLEMGFMIPVRTRFDDGRVAATIYFYRDQPASDEAG